MKKATIWKCDVCGKEVENVGGEPREWGSYDILFDKIDEYGNVCSRECLLKKMNELRDRVVAWGWVK